MPCEVCGRKACVGGQFVSCDGIEPSCAHQCQLKSLWLGEIQGATLCTMCSSLFKMQPYLYFFVFVGMVIDVIQEKKFRNGSIMLLL